MDMRCRAERIDWIEREIDALYRRLGAVTHQSPHWNYKYGLKAFNEMDRRLDPAIKAWREDKADPIKSRAVLLLITEWQEMIQKEMGHKINYYFPAPKEEAAA
ncbi:hypothetical protein [Ensifer aridi]|uniref:hypothetical protein n=1 Tax=Ensifer aridi TaxID=1708715 RepID=UPI000A122EE3|nr:hypothetical protein [Ensifer aridi]